MALSATTLARIERNRLRALERLAERAAYRTPSAIAKRRREAQDRRAWYKREREFASRWREREALRGAFVSREDRYAKELQAARDFMSEWFWHGPEQGLPRLRDSSSLLQ